MVGGASRTEIAIAKDDPMVNYMLKVREEHAQKQNKDYSHVFRSKTRFDFIRLACIIVGIEFAYAAETAFVSPILLQIGIDHKLMTMVWGLSPLLGFFIAPLLGSISDRCRLSLGRRRPIIIILSLGILAGLLLVPYGKDLGQLLGDVENSPVISTYDTNTSDINAIEPTIVKTSNVVSTLGNYKYAVILTILGTILLDFDADTCQTPARAYLLDVCIPEDHAKALSTFSIMAGIGGTFGYALGGVDWEKTSIGSFLGGNIPTVFAIVTVIFVICFFITITSFREIPLGLMEKEDLLRPLSASAIKKELAKNNNAVYYIRETTSLELKMSDLEMGKEKPEKYQNKLDREVSTNAIAKDMSSTTLSSEPDDTDEKISLRQYLKSIVIMPKSMRILCLTNLLCWMAHVSYCLYFTDFVGEAVFGGDPSAEFGSTKFNLYQEGVRFGCWGMSIYAFSCSVYSMSVEKLLNVLGTKVVYIGGILIFAAGMLVLGVWPTKIGVLVLSSTAGIIYATIFTIPYILIAKYHAQGCFKVKSGENIPLKQSRGLGTDIAIISSMVFVAQLIVSMSVGSLITWLNTTSAVLYAACGLGIGAAVSAMNVLYI